MIVLYSGFMASSIHETMKPEKKSRHSVTGTPVQVRLQPSQLSELDEWRRMQPDLPNRSEALRRMMEIALKVKKPR